jgi:hypothetical protein
LPNSIPIGAKVAVPLLSTDEAERARNRLMAAAADAILFAHAQPGSKTERLAQDVVGWDKPVYTLDHAANEPLRQMGMAVLGADLLIAKPAISRRNRKTNQQPSIESSRRCPTVNFFTTWSGQPNIVNPASPQRLNR